MVKFGNGGETDPFANIPRPKSEREAQQMINDGRLKVQNYKEGDWYKKPDSNLENVTEIFDPTGFSSWDDVARSYQKNGLNEDTALELLGAIPLLGKLSKSAKAAAYVGKSLKGYNYNKKLLKAANVIKGTGYLGRATDAYQAGEQMYNK
jgi:hypothetical protein